jgi:microcystin-dependent protein
MSRVKTFESTGIAPNGRLYAGDLNQIQDQYADLVNFAQTLGVGVLQVGQTGLQLLRYATSPLEARITAALRTDGILRGLGGIVPGTFTTAQRDAIPVGSRPYGMQIVNTTTNQYEWNAGSDATPNWQPFGQPVGVEMDWPYSEATIPAGHLAEYGQAISRTTYPLLHARAAADGYPHGAGDGSTTFNLPDCRGRNRVGKDNMGGVAANRISAANNGTTLGGVHGSQSHTLILGEIPSHNHGGGSHTHTVVSHNHNVQTFGRNQFHGHEVWHNYDNIGYASGPNSLQPLVVNGTGAFISFNTQGDSPDHVHGIDAQAPATGGPSATVVVSEGGGGAHNNLQPGIIVNKIIKVG